MVFLVFFLFESTKVPVSYDPGPTFYTSFPQNLFSFENITLLMFLWLEPRASLPFSFNRYVPGPGTTNWDFYCFLKVMEIPLFLCMLSSNKFFFSYCPGPGVCILSKFLSLWSFPNLTPGPNFRLIFWYFVGQGESVF